MWAIAGNCSPVLSAFDATFHCSRGRFSFRSRVLGISWWRQVTSDYLLTLRGLDRIFRHGSHPTYYIPIFCDLCATVSARLQRH